MITVLRDESRSLGGSYTFQPAYGEQQRASGRAEALPYDCGGGAGRVQSPDPTGEIAKETRAKRRPDPTRRL